MNLRRKRSAVRALSIGAAIMLLAAKGKGMIAVLLPDTTTSARYESFDRPYLTKAFEAAGLASTDFKIDNAQGSATTMQTQAEAAITLGATVLLVDALDSGSGVAIEATAAAKGVKVIDYDRLTKGGAAGRYYVSFDNVKVGQFIGRSASPRRFGFRSAGRACRNVGYSHSVAHSIRSPGRVCRNVGVRVGVRAGRLTWNGAERVGPTTDEGGTHG